ncbi:MAG: TonB-dependent receptor [Pseudomonadota bacterium]|nr:TonB-dependent receptor [Pseudomonadota bacterium]
MFSSNRIHFKLNKLTLAVWIGLSSTHAFASETETSQLPTVTVEDSNLRGHSSMLQVKDDTIHTERVSAKRIEQKQAANLAQAIADEPGVRVSNECSMCGVKRIMLNGLKGEHTTLMTNGVPNSSIVEGFYGFDAIPMAGVSAIEISRGAGPSLIAPEAIGGVVNVVTTAPREDKLILDVSQGNQGYHKYQLSGTKRSKDGNTALAVSAQSDNIDQYDQDNNWVNESPALTNRSFNAHLWHRYDSDNRFEVRLEDQSSEIFGGPVLGSPFANSKMDARTQEASDAPSFVGDSINNKPNTDTTTARDFLENIESKKQSITAKWYSDINQNLQTRLTASHVDSSMDAIYEPTTYQADQKLSYIDARADYFLNDAHVLTIGTDLKLDQMNSSSTGSDNPANDSYDLQSNGFYIRDTWTPDTNWELATAIRVDKINVDFVDQDRTFDETIIAPRAHLRYDHNFNWTSRLSAGLGYRVPLQFFEADHGILDDGFAVDVKKLEKSQNLHYALNYTDNEMLFETTFSWAKVDNLAYIDADLPTPTLVNSDESGQVMHADMIVSYQLNAHWSVGAGVEVFDYDKAYRSTFGVIPVEEKIKLSADYEGHGWQANMTLTGIGSRKYSDYANAAYNDHYNDANGANSKGTSSPNFFTVDMRVAKEINKGWQVYAGVNNLTDYTQTSDGDSPLFFDGSDAGSSDWDVGHIWGPLRGRTVYAGTKLTF